MPDLARRCERLLDARSTEEVLSLCSERSIELAREALTAQARRALRQRSPDHLHLLTVEGGTITAYAQASISKGQLELELLGDDPEPGLLALALKEAADRASMLKIWLHGQRGALHAPLGGYAAIRVLHRLSRPLPGPGPGPALEGIELRPYEHERDASSWLQVNARAFASHPDQGQMTRAELDAMIEEAWFDPSGFLLAERAGDLLGFCWTKLHRDPWGAVGEIYVIGVDPAAAGIGLGRHLLRAGLAHMAVRGIKTAMLYVESDNEPALRLYAAEGFELEWRDALFAPRAS